jgi:methionyl-tRNA synthetase
MVAKNFGEIPTAYAVQPVDEELLATVRGAFDTVGGSLERHRQKAALAEVMRVVGEANAYVSKTEPFKLKGDDERERLATVLHTLVQAVSDINTLIAPFLPHAANRVHEVLGGDGEFMPMPRLETVRDLDDDTRSYPVITGEYTATPRWESRPVVPGTPIARPTGVFTKFDPEQVIEDERRRLDHPGA